MNRNELFAEIDALRLEIADPCFDRAFKNAANARIAEIFKILYPEPDFGIEAEEELAMAECPDFDELFA